LSIAPARQERDEGGIRESFFWLDGASLLRLFRRGYNAQLLHHSKLVEVVPALYHLAFIGETEDAYPRYCYLVAGGSDAPELALVGAASSPAGYDLVPLGYLILDGATKIGKGPVELAGEPLDVFRPTLLGETVRLVREVPVEDLIH
jgi:hypothetical protein